MTWPARVEVAQAAPLVRKQKRGRRHPGCSLGPAAIAGFSVVLHSFDGGIAVVFSLAVGSMPGCAACRCALRRRGPNRL